MSTAANYIEFYTRTVPVPEYPSPTDTLVVVKAKISAAVPKDWRSALEGSKERASRGWDAAETLPVRRAPSGIEFICFKLWTAASAGSEITSLNAHR